MQNKSPQSTQEYPNYHSYDDSTQNDFLCPKDLLPPSYSQGVPQFSFGLAQEKKMPFAPSQSSISEKIDGTEMRMIFVSREFEKKMNLVFCELEKQKSTATEKDKHIQHGRDIRDKMNVLALAKDEIRATIPSHMFRTKMEQLAGFQANYEKKLLDYLLNISDPSVISSLERELQSLYSQFDIVANNITAPRFV
jgi:hypothetical protein